jgi:heat shock protein HtpX
MIANLAMFASMFGGGSNEDDAPNPMVVMALAIVAPVAASVMQMALSRSREFEADRLGAELAGDPRPLASALAKLDRAARAVPMDVAPAQATAYIVNPLTGRDVRFSNLFLTHPPTEASIAALLADNTALASQS